MSKVKGKVVTMSAKLKPATGYPLYKATTFYCKGCGGTTYNSNICENPSCPNCPSCGKPKEECKCWNSEKPQ